MALIGSLVNNLKVNDKPLRANMELARKSAATINLNDLRAIERMRQRFVVAKALGQPVVSFGPSLAAEICAAMAIGTTGRMDSVRIAPEASE